MSQVHAVRRNPFSRLLGEAGIAFLCGLIFSGAETSALRCSRKTNSVVRRTTCAMCTSSRELDSDDPVAQQIMNSVMKRLTELKVPFELCSCGDLYENPLLVENSTGVIYHYSFRPWFGSILEGIPQGALLYAS